MSGENDDGTGTPADTTTPPGSGNESWRDSLPEDIRGDATLAKYENVDALASAHVNLQSHMGRDKIAKPVTDDDWSKVYDFMGRPESDDKYELKLPDGLPEPIAQAFGETEMAGFKTFAHSIGLSQDQASKLVEWQAGNMQTQFTGLDTAADDARKSADDTLRAEWGKGYDQQTKNAGTAFLKYGGDDLAAIMDSTGLGNHPAVIKAFANIAKSTMSDKDLIGGEGTGGENLGLTPEEARDQASELMSHPAYMDNKHPEHAGLVKQVSKIFERAYD